MSFPKISADGMYHQAVEQRRGKAYTVNRYARFAEDTKCCESCPYPDCVVKGERSCFRNITFDEYQEFIKIVQEKRQNGEYLLHIHQESGVSRDALRKMLAGSVFPKAKTQTAIKKYLEKVRKDHANTKRD